MGANGFTGWLSQDGEEWVMLDEQFGIAMVPTIIPAEEGMTEKSMEAEIEIPVTHTALLLPAPNPFNPQTVLRYQLKNASNVNLAVYNVKGERMIQLIADDISAGHHSMTWRGVDESGRRLASGTYYARFVSDGVVQTQRLLLVK